MTLRVPFEQFPATVKRLIPKIEAYVSALPGGCLLTAGDPKSNMLVVSSFNGGIDTLKEKMREAGIECFEGSWHDGDFQPHEELPAYIAAVAYSSGEERPGIWVDAYDSQPTPIQVLRNMFEEFRETGEIHEVTFEEFARLANANVLILSPEEIAGFISGRDC